MELSVSEPENQRDEEQKKNKNSAILTEAKQLNVAKATVMAVPSSGHGLAPLSQMEKGEGRTCEIKCGLPSAVTY